MTDKQIDQLKELLRGLGFSDSNGAEEYLMRIYPWSSPLNPTNSLLKFRNEYIKGTPMKTVPRIQELQVKEEIPFVNNLMKDLELQLKIFNNKSSDYKFEDNEWISVSELNDFAFCPASFSIKRTYNVGKTESMAYGTILHESGASRKILREALLRNEYIEERQKEYFLKRWILLYSGHINKDADNFINEKLKIIGQPDYVYINTEGDKIIVEDKFVFGYYKLQNMIKPYINNKIQVLAYMTYFEEIKSNYGILGYYHYSCEDYNTYDKDTQAPTSENVRCFLSSSYDGKAMTKKFGITHPINASFGSELTRTYDILSQFVRKNKEMWFNVSKLNHAKCNKCSVRSFCVHRTKKHEKLFLDYQRHFI